MSEPWRYRHHILDLPMDPETNRAQAETVREYLQDTVVHLWFEPNYIGQSREAWKSEIRAAMPKDKGYTDAAIEQALRDWKRGC